MWKRKICSKTKSWTVWSPSSTNGRSHEWKHFMCAFAILVPEITVNNINTTDAMRLAFSQTHTNTHIRFIVIRMIITYFYVCRYGDPSVCSCRNRMAGAQIWHTFHSHRIHSFRFRAVVVIVVVYKIRP